MHGVRHVGRDQHRAGDRPVAPPAGRRVGGSGQPLDDVLEEAAARPGHRAAADLLVVVADQHLGALAGAAASSASSPEWQQPRLSSRGAATQLPSAPATRGRLGVGQHEVVADDVVRRRRRRRRASASASPGSVPRSRSQTGTRCRCGSRVSPSFTLRSRWIASEGSRSGAPGEPDQRASSPPRSATRPATVSSRSSQVCQSPPPYGSTPTSR